jgi:S1-C subfamily serine protease
MGFSVYLGTQPDYSSSSKDGLKLDAVSGGSPAEKAGLKGGDIITGFDGKPISTINDYMESLRQHKPGDTVEILVKRDGKEVKLKATLGSRSHE